MLSIFDKHNKEKIVERKCSFRQWQVSGRKEIFLQITISFWPSLRDALAFITSLTNAPIENYVDLYFSI